MENTFLKEIMYNNHEGKPPKLIFLNVHGDDGKSFLKSYPEILKAIPESDNVLKTAIELDRDKFAGEIIEDIVKKIGIPILELRVQIPRFIIDTNRHPNGQLGTIQSPLRNIFDFDHHKSLTKKLLLIHKNITERISSIVSKLNTYVIDLHTMANISPSKQASASVAIQEGTGNIQGYINQWLYANGSQRKVNIMTKSESNQDLANLNLSILIAGSLLLNKIGTTFNEPYTLSPNLMSSHYMKKNGKTVTIDIPKGVLSKENQDSNMQLANLTLDPIKLNNIGSGFALAINRLIP